LEAATVSISKNAAYNVLGAALPSVLTLVTIPLYLQLVGLERYGILTLCLVILGYSGFLDVGLKYAVARKIAQSGDAAADDIVWTSAWLSLLTGLTGAALVYFGAEFYFGSMAHVSPTFRDEVQEAVPLLAALVPVGMVGGVLGGALQGRERFLAINLLGALGQTLGAVLPLLLAYFWAPRLSVLLTGALAAQLLPFPLSYWVCKRAVPLHAPRGPALHLVRGLLSFGGWISLAVIANAVIQTVDRLAIGSRIGAAAVPSYSIPYGLVSRIILIPHSLSGALFPRFANAEAQEQRRLTSDSIQAVSVIITPAIIGLIAAAAPFFTLWIGSELAVVSTPIAYVLAAGFWFYSIGHMAYTMLQATGRPDTVSKLLLAELIPYCVALWAALWAFGVIGAAAAFTLRAIVDCLLFLFLAAVPLAAMKRLLPPIGLMTGAIAAAAFLPEPLSYSALGLLFLASIIWSALNIPETLKPFLRKFFPYSRPCNVGKSRVTEKRFSGPSEEAGTE